MARRAKHPEERKGEIVAAARRLFLSRGFAKTTITEIIENVEVSKGLFYYYFGSKEEILDEIVDQLVDDEASTLKATAYDLTLSPPAQMTRMLRDHRAAVSAGHGSITAQIRAINNPEIVMKLIRRSVSRLAPIFVTVVERGVAEKVFAIDDARACVELLLYAFTFDAVFPEPELLNTSQATFRILLERALGAAPGTLPAL